MNLKILLITCNKNIKLLQIYFWMKKNIPYVSTLMFMAGCISSYESEYRKFDLEIGDIIEFGEYNWLVLNIEKEQALLISQNIINRRPISLSTNDHTWKNSCIRHWLNNDFYNTFDISDRNMIIPTEVINSNNKWFESYAGYDTIDYIFLLSIDEVLQYLGGGAISYIVDGSGNLVGVSDEKAYKRIALSMIQNEHWWWLRSPGQHDNFNANVLLDGSVNIQGVHSNALAGGVRPALWISLTP